MRIWGITGTNGKTTCTWIASAFIDGSVAADGSVRRCGYVTTVEVDTKARRFSTGYTTPPLPELRRIFEEMESSGCTDCVMEVSSHAIHQNRTGETLFAGGAFTNLSEDHLDYHKTMEEYFRVKLSFAEKIAAQHPALPSMGRRELAPYVVCLDGANGPEMFAAVGNLPLNAIPVSSAHPAYDLRALRLKGAFNRSNVLVAAALAEAAGVSPEVIQARIPLLEPRWGRLERVANPEVAADVYVDFAHTPDGLEKVLSAVRGEMQPSHALWIVFGAGGDRDPMKRPLMGEACARLADRLVVTSDNPRSEEPLAIIESILNGVRTVRPIDATVAVEPDRARAIARALTEAASGDVVVIAGKGHETTQEVKGVKTPFDDRETVRSFGRDCKCRLPGKKAGRE